MVNEEDIELFERYTKGLLSHPEVNKFNDRLKNDSELKAWYETYEFSLLALKKSNFDEALQSKPKLDKPKGNWVLLAILCIVFCLVYLVYNSYKSTSQTNSKTLYAAYFEPFPDLISTRGEESGLNKALIAYNDGNFDTAFELLDTSIYKSDLIKVYRAISLLSSEFESAKHSYIQELKSIEDHSQFVQYRNWYLSLSYLKQDAANLAKDELSKIREGDYKYDDALKILSTLNIQD